MTRRRTLTVLIEEVAIEDGEIPPPQVGSVLSFPLRFRESPTGETVSADLEPTKREPILQYTGQDSPRRLEWHGLLRGDGWTASWRSFRPRTGRVELTGHFVGTMGYDTYGRVRGRVTRVQIASERYRKSERGWVPVLGHRRLREVDAAPRFFDRDAIFRENLTETDLDVGALVELDLDDVPPLPPRPRIVPGDISASGTTLWVADTTLPVVVRITLPDSATELVLPAPTGPSRRLWATPSGCWVGGTDGLYRCDSEAHRVDDLPVGASCAVGETLLTCPSDGSWRLYAPGQETVDVVAPEGYVASVVEHDGFFFAAVRHERQVRIVRVTTAGAVTVGPILPSTSDHHGMPFLTGAPLRIFRGSSVSRVLPDLTTVAQEPIPRTPLDGGSVGGLVWTTGHPPDGTGPSGWWPLPGPVSYQRGRQSWLFTVHDPVTLEPVTSTPLHSSRPSVTVDGNGTVWVVADGVHSLTRTTMDPPVTLDVAALLETKA